MFQPKGIKKTAVFYNEHSRFIACTITRLFRFLFLGLLFISPFFSFSQGEQYNKGNPIREDIITSKNNPFYSHYNVTSLGAGYGLNSSDISALYQDQDGFVWVGNKPGVSRFDGYKFQNYTKAGNGYLGQIHSIAEDATGTLWIGGVNGLFYFKDGQFHSSQLGSFPLRTLHAGGNGELWVGGFGFIPFALSPEELIKIKDREIVSVKPIVSEKEWEEKIGVLKTWALTTDASGTLWLGLEHGHASFTQNELTVEWMDYSDKYEFSDVVAVNKDSVFWGSEVRSVLFQKKGQLTSLTNSYCYLMEQTDTSIYLLTSVDILELNRKGEWKKLHVLDEYNHVYLKKMLLDKEGNFWIGIEGNLLILSPSRFKSWTFRDNPLLKASHSVAELPSGKIIIGGSKTNLLHFEDHQFVAAKDLDAPYNSVTSSIYIDENDWIWYATTMGGIILDRHGYYEKFSEDKGLGDKGQYFITKDTKGNLWSGGEGGISRITIDKKEQLRFENFMVDVRLSEVPIFRSIFEGSDGMIWAVGDKGLYHLKQGELTHWAFIAPFTSSPIVTSATIDDDGILWIGTQGEGLWQCQFNEDHEPRVIRQWTEAEGLLSDVILDVHIDQVNRVWAVSQNGICYLVDEGGEAGIKCYDQLDGWSDEPTSHCHLLESSDRLLWAVGSAGVTVFPLYDLPGNKVKPNVFINEVQLFDGKEDIFKYADNAKAEGRLPENLILPYQKNFIRFNFTTTSYTAPQKNKFRYQLEGLDADWNRVDKNNSILYPGLQPGKYTFKVLAANNDGLFGDEPAVFHFEILTPWYQSWWFYLLCILFLSALYFYWYRFELDKKTAQQEAERLKSLDEFKTRFYANITHEFRTPLTVISGMADELKNNSKVDPHKKIRLIKKNSEDLLSLVNQLLNLSKLQVGKVDRHVQQSDIIAYLKYLTESHASFAKVKDIGLQFYSEEKEWYMDFDLNSMEQILNNLLSNAIKFTPVYGKILVIAKPIKIGNDPVLEIKIKDNGIGIDKAQLPYIFDRFHQANPIHENQGSGIGLSLVKELVNLSGGKISVESKIEEGTTFFLYFPISTVAPRVSLTERPPAKLSTKPDETAVLSSHSKDDLPILLIIEDNADVTYYLKTCLQNDYQIIASRNGRKGIEVARENLPDIIISDVMMPEMDGFEVCEKLKNDERTSHIPIILLTAKATQKDKLTGLSFGADAYLIKPFEKEELFIRLNKLLEIRQKLQEKYSATFANGELAVVPKNQEEHFLQKVERIILKKLDSDRFSIHELSRDLHLSRSQAHRKIKALTGMSPAVYIRHVRLHKAKDLLISTNLPIAEIAYQVGFKTPVYFSQAFKELFGKSPTATRK